MVFSERDLSTEWGPQVRFPDGENISLADVRNAIQNEAYKNGIPVAFREAELKVGGLFNKQMEDVLLMCNPDHAGDYLKFVIRIQHMGKYAFMHIYNMGGSKNYLSTNRAAAGGVLGTAVKIGGILKGTNAKLQEEEQYYAILSDVIRKSTGV